MATLPRLAAPSVMLLKEPKESKILQKIPFMFDLGMNYDNTPILDASELPLPFLCFNELEFEDFISEEIEDCNETEPTFYVSSFLLNELEDFFDIDPINILETDLLPYIEIEMPTEKIYFTKESPVVHTPKEVHIFDGDGLEYIPNDIVITGSSPQISKIPQIEHIEGTSTDKIENRRIEEKDEAKKPTDAEVRATLGIAARSAKLPPSQKAIKPLKIPKAISSKIAKKSNGPKLIIEPIKEKPKKMRQITIEESAPKLLQKVTNKNKCTVVDKKVMKFPEAANAFSGFFVAVRDLSLCDIEVTLELAAFIGIVSMKRLSAALTVFPRVLIVSTSISDGGIEAALSDNRIRYRYAPDIESALRIAVAEANPAPFLRKPLSLHEFTLTRFGFVPTMSVQKWLAVGNPVSNRSVLIGDDSGPAKVLMALLDRQQGNKAKPSNPGRKRTEAPSLAIRRLKQLLG